MKSTFRILFYVKKDKQRADGTFPIMCRITIDGQASRFYTKTNVNLNVWNAKTGAAIGKSKEAVEINALLDTIKTSIHNVYHDLQTKENNVVLLNSYSTIIFAEKKLWIVQDVEA